jgi:hypothetical protein
MNTDNPTEPFATKAAEAAREAYQAGYQAGYQAAVANIINAVQPAQSLIWQGVPPSDVDMRYAQTGAEQGLQAQQSGVASSVYTTIPKTASGRAAPGAIKRLVFDFVAAAGHPVTEYDFAGRYPEVGRPSRYMAFRSLRDDGVITKQGRSWVLAPKGEGNPADSTGGVLLNRREGGTGNEPA